MESFRPRRLRRDITAVVFAGDGTDLSRFSTETGPCVPLVAGGKALASVLTQHGGETPALTAALYTALTGRPRSEALVLLNRDGRGRLSRCSDEFVTAMAACCEESLCLADEDESRGYDDLPSFARQQDDVSRAWMHAGRWPREVVGLTNRLVRLGVARQAVASGKPVFVWHGPPMPQFVVTSGQGPYSPPP